MTTEDVTTQPDEERWWKLLRRAFRIPDIVSDCHTESAVTHALLQRLPPLSPSIRTRPGFDPHQERVDDSGTIVRAIVQTGGKGELDELFVALGLFRADRNTLIERFRSKTGFVETPGLIEKAFEVVTDYVKVHPFEDSPDSPTP
jgi:hypothetical protein